MELARRVYVHCGDTDRRFVDWTDPPGAPNSHYNRMAANIGRSTTPPRLCDRLASKDGFGAVTNGLTFEAAQQELVSSAPECFRLDRPPAIGWWIAKFGLALPAAAFLHHFQCVLGSKTYRRDDCHWEVDYTPNWQAAAGVSPNQWPTIKQSLGPSGANLLSYAVHQFWTTKATWIRPSKDFLAIFGLSLEIYGAVAALDFRVGQQLNPKKGPKVPDLQPLSTDELTYLMLWAASGGLPRLRRSDYLDQQLQTYKAQTDAA